MQSTLSDPANDFKWVDVLDTPQEVEDFIAPHYAGDINTAGVLIFFAEVEQPAPAAQTQTTATALMAAGRSAFKYSETMPAALIPEMYSNPDG